MKGQNMISNEAKKMLTLALEYILKVGIEKALVDISDVTVQELKDYPHVREALEERDLIKWQ
jgi:hypothetical protein